MALPRTYLFVPGDRPERFAKALATAADAVIVDLEDAVLPAAKPSARDAVAAFLAACPTGGTDRGRLVVRVNDESTPWFADDLALLASHGVQTVMLPKAERVATVARLRTACPLIAVLALVESARGVQAAEDLAAAPGVQRLVFGTLDFALDLDMGNEAFALDPVASRLAVASRAAGIASPVAGVTTALDDESLLLADLARARAFGFGSKLCIHPKQVEPIHAALRPTDAERHWAQRVLDAAAASPGAVQLDGRMVDRPVIERARRLLERADR
jgi:citrate lyase subunit beta/citryl-CoA lyase